ncbi:MAG: MBL fold metallo-hydrolase [Bacteroidetes bacterium]|nr:MBL fold metallo-hydrolase [Bacteroidota bacterium]
MKIQFLGAAREVTGSKHLITLDNGKKILLDCGMFQGKGLETHSQNENLGFNPMEIDYLVLSHAHIDHSGCIPYMVKLGFDGMILCTNATRDLCSIMLTDSARIQEHDTRTYNKKRAHQGLKPLEPFYKIEDAEQSLNYFVSISYNNEFKLTDGVYVTFTDAGHILGSAAVNIRIKEGAEEKRICYTGDIGRSTNMILKHPQPFPQADFIITESTYGDRIHDNHIDSQKKLMEVIVDTCVKKKGKLIIPSFSVGRTQEIVYAIHQLVDKGWMPKINVYVDSPLSVNATNVMRLHPECFNEDMLERMEKDPDPFGFNNLYYLRSQEDSKRLNEINEPCIIISASGMMEAGRVKHHIANSISNPKNTILVVGYCAPSTLGARIVRGDKSVSIFGVVHEVKADIQILESYSAHGDYNEMIVFLSCQDKKKIKKIFVVHGEYETQVAYREKLMFNHFEHIEIPEKGQEFIL